jgi:hypothetical protein
LKRSVLKKRLLNKKKFQLQLRLSQSSKLLRKIQSLLKMSQLRNLPMRIKSLRKIRRAKVKSEVTYQILDMEEKSYMSRAIRVVGERKNQLLADGQYLLMETANMHLRSQQRL